MCDPIWHVSSSSGVATSVSELLYPCYFTLLHLPWHALKTAVTKRNVTRQNICIWPMCKMPGRPHSMLAMMVLLLLLSYTTDLCGFSCWSCSRCNWTGKEINQAGGNVLSFVNLTFFTLHAYVCLTTMKQWINVIDRVYASLYLCISLLAFDCWISFWWIFIKIVSDNVEHFLSFVIFRPSVLWHCWLASGRASGL